MPRISIIFILFIALFLGSCSSTTSISKNTDSASQALATGDYETAYTLYNSYIQQHKEAKKEVEGNIFASAGKAALKLNKIEEAEAYFKEAYYKKYADADMYNDMISIYKKQDNLSKEMDALEFFTQNFATDSRFTKINNRLFATYIESENWDKAVDMWPFFTAKTQKEIPLMELYLIAQKKLDNNAVADKLALDILNYNGKNKIALEQLASKYFWKAENNYQAEIEAYEKNKTNKQYNIMLKALDGITADFKKSLAYYQKLYKLYPSKEYAKYIANIYTRFQDKNNADKYRKLAE